MKRGCLHRANSGYRVALTRVHAQGLLQYSQVIGCQERERESDVCARARHARHARDMARRVANYVGCLAPSKAEREQDCDKTMALAVDEWAKLVDASKGKGGWHANPCELSLDRAFLPLAPPQAPPVCEGHLVSVIGVHRAVRDESLELQSAGCELVSENGFL